MSIRAAVQLREAHGEDEVALGAIVGNPRLHASILAALDGAGITLVACAKTANELAVTDSALEVVVLHTASDRASLLDSLRAAREALPATPLIVVWPQSNASDARRALRAGADGLVSEAGLAGTLAPTIHAVRSGLVCVPRPMRAPLESESLSMREKQVLGMLVMGFTNAEIGQKLYLAESTVKSHLSSAYNKLGVRSRKDAASMILDPSEGLGPGILAISPA